MQTVRATMEQKRSVGEVMWPPVREFMAGSFAGFGLILSGYPFDTIKVFYTLLSLFLVLFRSQRGCTGASPI